MFEKVGSSFYGPGREDVNLDSEAHIKVMGCEDGLRPKLAALATSASGILLSER